MVPYNIGSTTCLIPSTRHQCGYRNANSKRQATYWTQQRAAPRATHPTLRASCAEITQTAAASASRHQTLVFPRDAGEQVSELHASLATITCRDSRPSISAQARVTFHVSAHSSLRCMPSKSSAEISSPAPVPPEQSGRQQNRPTTALCIFLGHRDHSRISPATRFCHCPADSLELQESFQWPGRCDRLRYDDCEQL